MELNSFSCWKCEVLIDDPIGFRSSCPHCHADLHVCKNCRYYSPGKPNDCLIPGTDPIRDRELANWCDEFKVKKTNVFRPPLKKNIFGEDDPPPPTPFNDLFK